MLQKIKIFDIKYYNDGWALYGFIHGMITPLTQVTFWDLNAMAGRLQKPSGFICFKLYLRDRTGRKRAQSNVPAVDSVSVFSAMFVTQTLQ